MNEVIYAIFIILIAIPFIIMGVAGIDPHRKD